MQSWANIADFPLKFREKFSQLLLFWILCILISLSYSDRKNAHVHDKNI